MSDDTKQMMKMLDQHLSVQEYSGRTVLQVALFATVYFAEPYRRQVREAVAACCEDYFQRCGQHLRWALNPDTDLMEPFGTGKASKPRTWVPLLGEDEVCSIIYHGAEHERGASAFMLESLGTERRPYEKLGFLRVFFPLLWFAENGASLPEVLLEICRKLKPVSGYGGIGVAESPDTSVSCKYEPLVYQWTQRFPGLEADYPCFHGNYMRDISRPDDWVGRRHGIKGANWLTVLGDRYLAELGGVEKVSADLAAMDSRFVVHRYEGGALIQAGPYPVLGDVQRDLWPELVVKLSKYLKPIRITTHRSFHYANPGVRFNKLTSEAWLRRFDDR
jgi:hypothetical protein